MHILPVVAIVGRPNVGKSTLFNRLTKTSDALVSDFPGMTRDRQYGEAQIDDRRFIVIDTGGITDEENAIDKLTTAQAHQAIKEADKVLFVVDARAGLTPADRDIAVMLRTLDKPIAIIVNKAEDLDPDIVLADFYALGFGTLHPISAAHGRNVTEMIEDVFANESIQPEEEQDSDSGIKLATIDRGACFFTVFF